MSIKYLQNPDWISPIINGIMPIYDWNEYDVNSTECISDILYIPGFKIMLNWELLIALILNFILYAEVMKIALQKAKKGLRWVSIWPDLLNLKEIYSK